jgi:hypothetical protein
MRPGSPEKYLGIVEFRRHVGVAFAGCYITVGPDVSLFSSRVYGQVLDAPFGKRLTRKAGTVREDLRIGAFDDYEASYTNYLYLVVYTIKTASTARNEQ